LNKVLFDRQMLVKVLYFASTREITGKTQEAVELEDGSTVKDLQTRLSAAYVLLDFERHCIKLAVNKQYQTEDTLLTKLKDGDEVALIPPISGG
jgi:molybdopterin converting factor subunit 1